MATRKMKSPHYPIVYVRGYAGSQDEVEDTVATPYMGFNLGSTKIRQIWTGDIERYIFESPLVRLMKEHGYSDIFEAGSEIAQNRRPPDKSVWIYRYYEPVSADLGTGARPEMEDYAKGLHDLIEAMRDQYCGRAGDSAADVQAARQAFKVYLVAHSMGGLVVRCYLQNIARDRRITPPVDKVYTYATPHGGIDFRLIGNIPSFLQFNNIENFNEARMREYLKLGGGDSTQSLDGAFDPDRFFCLVGTNHRDYTAASGLSRVAVGPMSDGLVQIKNSYVQGSPRAFVHRSHSGHYGIVNSEEGYQMLRRFLFGDVRVDALMEIEQITLPAIAKLEKAEKDGKLDYSHHVEVIARVRGARWDLHRRTVAEESAKFLTAERLKKAKTNPLHLASAYLMKSAKVNKRRRTLGFSVEIGVLVPEYVVDGFWFMDDHYEGGYLFRDKLNLEVDLEHKPPRLKYGWDKETPNLATSEWLKPSGDDPYQFRIPFQQDTRPGVKGTLIFEARKWS